MLSLQHNLGAMQEPLRLTVLSCASGIHCGFAGRYGQILTSLHLGQKLSCSTLHRQEVGSKEKNSSDVAGTSKKYYYTSQGTVL